MYGFSVEESNLISIYAGENRIEVIEDISRAIKYMDDNELVVLSKKVIEQLKSMSDEEFEKLSFVAAE